MSRQKPERDLVKHSIAGLGAGAISTVALYPLDLVKIQYQVHENSAKAYRSTGSALQTIWQKHGARGLFRGMSPALYGATASWGLYFFFYERAKQRHSESAFMSRLSSPVKHFISGIEAGSMCIFFVNPIWLIKVRMQVQLRDQGSTALALPKPYTSVSNAFRRIVAEEGILALYKGVVPALLLTTHGAFKFVAYEKLKSTRNQYITTPLDMKETLVIGAISQAFASTATYPYQVIKARLQQGGPAAEKYSGTWDCTKKILRNESVRGLYKGLSPNLMKVIPSGALTFAVYEKIMSILK